MNDHNKKSGGKKTRIALIILCVILALVLVVLIAGAAFLESTLNLINRVQDTTAHTLSSEEISELYKPDETEESGDDTIPEIDPSDVIWDTVDPGLMENEEHIINILLIGQDRREGQGRQRSDTMILCTFNTQKKTLTMTSFMRDTYVQIPGYKDNRMNAAYVLGGMPLLDQVLEKNFGVTVDGNVEVDFGQFQRIIDLLGGVEIELTAKEAEHMNSRWGHTVSAGTRMLTGEEALDYCRIRYIDSDFKRTERQRKVLNSLIQAYKDLPLTQMMGLLTEILPMVTTDLTNSEIIGLAQELFPMLSSCTITSQRIPADGAYSSQKIRGMAVLVPDLAKAQQMLAESIGN